MEIYFCAKCNSRLTDTDLERGTAVQVGEEVYCRKCSPVIPVGPPPSARKPGQTNRGLAVKSSGLRGATRGPRESGMRPPTRSTPAYAHPARSSSRTPVPSSQTAARNTPPAARRTPPAVRRTPPPQPADASDAVGAPPTGQAPAHPPEPGKTPTKGATGAIPVVARGTAPSEAAKKTGRAKAIQPKEKSKPSILKSALIGLVVGAIVVLLYCFFANKGLIGRDMKRSLPPSKSDGKR